MLFISLQLHFWSTHLQQLQSKYTRHTSDRLCVFNSRTHSPHCNLWPKMITVNNMSVTIAITRVYLSISSRRRCLLTASSPHFLLPPRCASPLDRGAFYWKSFNTVCKFNVNVFLLQLSLSLFLPMHLTFNSSHLADNMMKWLFSLSCLFISIYMNDAILKDSLKSISHHLSCDIFGSPANSCTLNTVSSPLVICAWESALPLLQRKTLLCTILIHAPMFLDMRMLVATLNSLLSHSYFPFRLSIDSSHVNHCHSATMSRCIHCASWSRADESLSLWLPAWRQVHQLCCRCRFTVTDLTHAGAQVASSWDSWTFRFVSWVRRVRWSLLGERKKYTRVYSEWQTESHTSRYLFCPFMSLSSTAVDYVKYCLHKLMKFSIFPSYSFQCVCIYRYLWSELYAVSLAELTEWAVSHLTLRWRRKVLVDAASVKCL